MVNLYKMRRAFTLVELLVVMAIMMILTVITVSQFRTAKRKANDVARKGDLNAVAKALQMYYADYNKMPESVDGQISVGGDSKEWGTEFNDAGGYVYMKKLPSEKDGWNQYCYKTDGAQKKYALFANLENTVDSECEGHNYLCNGIEYCFAYVSPNTSLSDDGELQ